MFSLKEFILAKNILLYYPLTYEPDLRQCLLLKNKNLFLPRVNRAEIDICEYNSDKLFLGSFNIIEPSTEKITDYNIIDLVVTPAVAADKNGYRLGYGKGYYDRLFPKLKQNCIKIIIVYDDLILNTIYPSANDVKCDFIVSEKQVYEL